MTSNKNIYILNLLQENKVYDISGAVVSAKTAFFGSHDYRLQVGVRTMAQEFIGHFQTIDECFVPIKNVLELPDKMKLSKYTYILFFKNAEYLYFYIYMFFEFLRCDWNYHKDSCYGNSKKFNWNNSTVGNQYNGSKV